METKIGKFAKETGTVDVTFEHAGVTHARTVNAVLVDGIYDAKATAARVAEVARGVEAKIICGAITNPPPAPETETPTSAA